MSYADKIGVPFVVLLGEDEIEKDMLSVKNMLTGEQTMLTAEEAGTLIRENVEKRNSTAPIRG